MPSNFEVKFDGVKITKAQQARIARGISTAAMAEIAALNLGGKKVRIDATALPNGGDFIVKALRENAIR